MVLAALLLLLAWPAQDPAATDIVTGSWVASVECPGGPIRFGLQLEATPTGLAARVVNAGEVRPVSVAKWNGSQLGLRFDPYDSNIRATLDDKGRMVGRWSKLSSGRIVELPFKADRGQGWDPGAFPALDLAGRWAARFSASDDPAVLVLERRVGPAVPIPRGEPCDLLGTFLTTLGDYRFLSGWSTTRDDSLELACFDGAHAFLFRARLLEDGSLAGDFWSADRWHETWSAVRDPDAALPDPFGISAWNREVRLADLAYPDLEGRLRALDEEAFRGKARILQVFGTWCPNCNDEAPFLAELDDRYRARGLSVLGLAFEHGDDHAYAAGRVRAYAERYGIRFPILVAGTSDKQAASEAFPLLDRVRAFPTTLFLDHKGEVRAVHTGFSGPASGGEHEKLRADFERLIETLLAQGEEEVR
jgi:thiol-disulfide isomerase/thioredoxin